MSRRLAVVPCSAAKLDHDAPAGELYRGSLTRSAVLAAEALTAAGVVDGWLILSALHGLVEPSWVIGPYDVTWGDVEAIGPQLLADQLAAVDDLGGLLPLLPGRYAAQLDAAAQLAGQQLLDNPLAGSRGLLEQRRRLRELRESCSA